MPKEYYKTLCPKTYNDVFNSLSPSIASYKRVYGTNGLMATQAIMTIIIRDLVKSFNLGQTMDDEQVADLINDIIDQYYFLKIEDFRFCFNMAKAGRYDKGIFRLDASIILSWLNKYTSDRINEADEANYNSHLSTKGDSTVPELEKVYRKFKKWD